jgi:hypothetical protein
MVTGISGIGKTYTVKSRLKANGLREGHDYHFVSGHSSPLGLYRFLYEHRDSIIVFDDCDSIFEHQNAIDLLKASLDMYTTRTVHWQSSRMPDDLECEFDFEGQIIFVSNLDSSQIDNAVKSRTMVIDLQMSRKELCEYMKSIIHVIEPSMSEEYKLEVLAFLADNYESYDQFNLRTLVKTCKLRKRAAKRDIDWKKMSHVLI